MTVGIGTTDCYWIVARVLPILTVCFVLVEFIAADNGDFRRILTADRVGLVLKLYWRLLAAFGGVSKFNPSNFNK